MERRRLSIPAAALAAVPILLAIALVAGSRIGTGEGLETAAQRTFDMPAPPPPAGLQLPRVEIAAPPFEEPPVAPRSAPPGELPLSMPRIAYVYGYVFRLPTEALAGAQERHLELCRQLGPFRCRVVSLQRGEREGEAVAASLNLEVAAGIASEFGRRLADISSDAGAEMVDRTIAAEDITRQMIDTEARARTRETLIRRLTGLLEARSGNIEQAVEAERAINAAQEELEAARAWLAEMRGRVAMTKVEIGYQSSDPIADRSRSPIGDAFAQVGAVSVASLASLIVIAGTLLPWLVFGGLAWLAVRAIRRRRAHATEEPSTDSS